MVVIVICALLSSTAVALQVQMHMCVAACVAAEGARGCSWVTASKMGNSRPLLSMLSRTLQFLWLGSRGSENKDHEVLFACALPESGHARQPGKVSVECL